MTMIPDDKNCILSLREKPWYVLLLIRKDLYPRISMHEKEKKKKKKKEQYKYIGLK